jgi:mannose/fructose/N-acetylgalactosamine-specific phosphotransferase system component IID/mannose/fructose/N-acetylgalactosamine-specific phosphotransferase system component IIC
MMISLSQALLIGLLYFAANTSFLAGLGYFTTWRPLVNGFLVGLVLGDPERGTIIGALINVLYLGYLSAGGTLGIGDAALAGIIGAAIGIATPLADLSQAIGLGVLGGVLLANLGFPLLSLRMRLDNHIVHRMDQAATRGDARSIVRLNIIAGQALLFGLTVPTAAILGLGAPVLMNLAAGFAPDWMLRAVAVAGTGMAAALGIALAMKFVFKGAGVPLFILGFALVAVLSINVAPFVALGLALIGLWSLAKFVIYIRPFRKHRSGAVYPMWQFFSHSSYSFERLQGSGFACALALALQRLYPSLQDRAAALMRHLSFFNVEPNWGTVVLGVTLKLEEQHAAGTVDIETITTTKQALMGTVSGFGDRVSQGAILPLLLSIAIGICLDPTQPWFERMTHVVRISPIPGFTPWHTGIGVIVYLALICPLMLAISYVSFHVGYERGRAAVIAMLGNATLKRFVAFAEWLGALMLGALAAMPSVTGLRLNLLQGETRQAVNLAAAVVLVMLFYVLVQRYQVRPTVILLGIIVVSLVLALAQVI